MTLIKPFITLAPSRAPRVRDSAIEKIEVKLTHFFFKKPCIRSTTDSICLIQSFTVPPALTSTGFELRKLWVRSAAKASVELSYYLEGNLW
jgi:hypothetical protein